MQSTASVLLKKSILKPSGEISKDKINLVAGAITQPGSVKSYAQI